MSGLPQPPNDRDAERALLGGIIRDPDTLAETLAIIRAEMFYYHHHQRIFTAIVNIAGRGDPIDLVSLNAELTANGDLADIGGTSYLVELWEAVPTAANSRYYAKLIIEASTYRKLIHLAQQAIAECYSHSMPLDEGLASLERKLFTLSAVGDAEPRLAGEIMLESLAALDNRIASGETLTGLSTGYPGLDYVLGGLRPGELVVIGARPSIGKSSLSLCIAEKITGNGNAALFFSLEMPANMVADRLLSMASGVSMHRMSRPSDLQKEDIDSLYNAGAGESSKLPLYVDDASDSSAARILSISQKMVRRKGVKVVIVDYLQLMRPDNPKDNKTNQIGTLALRMKHLARTLNINVILLSQLNREVEGQNRRPRLSDLRDCVVGETLLTDFETGRQVPIREVEKNQVVLSLDSNQRVVPSYVEDVWPTGVKPVFLVRTQSGREITATANHPLLSPSGWKKVSELQIGDELAVAFNANLAAKADGNADECRLLGYLAGNGSVQKHRTIGLILPDNEVFSDAKEIIRNLWPLVNVRVRNSVHNDAWLSQTINGYGRPGGNEVINWLKTIGFYDCRDHSKRVPDYVWRSGRAGAANFLSGYLATDGCIKKGGTGTWIIHFDTTSLGLASDTLNLLVRVGVFANVSPPSMSVAATKPIYRVTVSSDRSNLLRFAEQIPVRGRKGRILGELLLGDPKKTRFSAMKLPPLVSAYAATVSSWRHQGKSISRTRCSELAKESNDGTLAMWAESDVAWDRVVSITPVGNQETFDIRINRTHSFIGNGIVAHNSGEIEQHADSVLLLYRDPALNMTDEVWPIEVIVAKNRNGPIGDVTLSYRRPCLRFENHVP